MDKKTASLTAIEDRGTTSLHRAARHGDARRAQMLPDHRANPDVATEDGETPLHLAASIGDRRMAGELLAGGAVADARNQAGMTPLHLAIVHHRWSCDTGNAQRRLRRPGHRSGTTQPSESEIARGLAMVELLLSAGASPSVQDGSGRTALHVAANRHAADVVALLVDHGADVDAVNDEGRTALHDAVTFACWPTADALLRHGASADVQAPGLGTPLDASGHKGCAGLRDLLRQYRTERA